MHGCATANHWRALSASPQRSDGRWLRRLQKKCCRGVTGSDVSAGDIIYPEPELLTVHDWYVVNFDKALQALDVEQLYDPDKLVISTDHEPVAVSPQAAERQKQVREIVKKYGIKNFYDAGRGGHGHVFPVEMGYVKPGMFVEAYDVHVTNFGAVGALAIPVLIEITEVLACGSVWLRTPRHGTRQPYRRVAAGNRHSRCGAKADL